ncbi:hypothetical protein ACFLY4_04700 [Chloroflexota bacterium]
MNKDLEVWHSIFIIEQVIPRGFQKILAEGVQANIQHDNESRACR